MNLKEFVKTLENNGLIMETKLGDCRETALGIFPCGLFL